MESAFLASEYAPSPAHQAFFHCLPVPFEASVSYGAGTKNGPSAILEASQQLEAWEMQIFPGRFGIYTAKPIPCDGEAKDVLKRIEEAVCTTLTQKALPILLGGEHTITLGALRAYAKCGRVPAVVQIDAHADLRKDYEGNPYSHASVMYRAVTELNIALAQFGIREFSAEEVARQKEHGIYVRTAEDLLENGIAQPIVPPSFPKTVYVSFDVDGLDCSLMPATGTPACGGLFWHQVYRLLSAIARDHTIVGFDVVELAPIAGFHSANFVAAKIVHLLMAMSVQSGAREVIPTYFDVDKE